MKSKLSNINYAFKRFTWKQVLKARVALFQFDVYKRSFMFGLFLKAVKANTIMKNIKRTGKYFFMALFKLFAVTVVEIACQVN